MLKTRTSKKNSSNKKLIDSQESPACRGKNNILGRDLDIYKKCILKESKLEANKNNMKWHSLHNNIICLNEFKKFQFETELALQTAALRQHIDESYAWMAPDDREKLFARWTRRIRADLLDRFDAPRSEWKERFINEEDFDEEDNDDLTTNDDSRGTITPSSRRGVESEMGQHDNYENESIKTKDSIDQKFEDFKKILESTEEQRLSVVLFASKAKTSNYCIYKFEKNGFFEKNFKQPIQAKSTFKTFRPEEQIKEEQQFKKDYLLKMERRKIDENRKRVKKFLSVESFYTI